MVMILYFIAIQYGNDYIMQLFMNALSEIDYITHVFLYFCIDNTYLCILFIFSVF